jgi:hypothetical protein
LLPILYLKGISTGDFSEALAALLGKDAAGLSASAIGRLKDGWIDEHAAWQKRDLSAKRYVYICSRRAVGAEGFTISIILAGSAVTHIRPQHCPSDECGAFSGTGLPFNAIDMER